MRCKVGTITRLWAWRKNLEGVQVKTEDEICVAIEGRDYSKYEKGEKHNSY